MAQRSFDGLQYARQLKAAGVPQEQADIMAESLSIFADNLVTRDHLDARFAAQDARMEARFAEQDARIEARFSRVDLKINTLTVMVAAIFAATVLPELARVFQ